MADKKQAKGEKTVVTRIKATESTPPKKPSKDTVAGAPANTTKVKAKSLKQPKPAEVAKQKAQKTEKNDKRNAFMAFIGYFKGAWYELKQVHWPTRRATWSMTGAVLLFTAIFAVLILLLDAGFQLLFDQII